MIDGDTCIVITGDMLRFVNSKIIESKYNRQVIDSLSSIVDYKSSIISKSDSTIRLMNETINDYKLVVLNNKETLNIINDNLDICLDDREKLNKKVRRRGKFLKLSITINIITLPLLYLLTNG